MRWNHPGTDCSKLAGHARRMRFAMPRRAIAGVLLATLAGCRSAMYDQPRYEPLESSSFFPDGSSARPLVEGTLPQLDGPAISGIADPALLVTGMRGGQLATVAPYPVDRGVLKRGQERYRIFCIPCHGELGDGHGIVVQRGFPAPPALFNDELRHQPLGHFFEVITNGHGVMYSYAARVPPRDRWAIAAYIRALQLSQYAVASDLPALDRRAVAETTHEPATR